MIALLPEPFSGSADTGPCMVIGLRSDEALIVEGDGTIRWCALTALNIDWRYVGSHQVWVDIGPYTEGMEIDGESDQEEADDGGEEVP